MSCFVLGVSIDDTVEVCVFATGNTDDTAEARTEVAMFAIKTEQRYGQN